MKANLPGHFERYDVLGSANSNTVKGYRDESCKAAYKFYGYRDKCIECPLPVCLNEPGGVEQVRMSERLPKVLKLITEGHTARSIALTLKVDTRTIQRDLKTLSHSCK